MIQLRLYNVNGTSGWSDVCRLQAKAAENQRAKQCMSSERGRVRCLISWLFYVSVDWWFWELSAQLSRFQALIHHHITPHASPFNYLLIYDISCLIHTPCGIKSVCECGNNRCCVPGSLSKRGMKWGDDDSICLTVLCCSVWAAWKCSLSFIHYTILLSCMLDYEPDVV